MYKTKNGNLKCYFEVIENYMCKERYNSVL